MQAEGPTQFGCGQLFRASNSELPLSVIKTVPPLLQRDN